MGLTHDSADLSLSAIAWNEDPAKCIAVVNDRIVHEGDFLGELRVLRIQRDHVVLLDGNEHVIRGMHTREGDPNPESGAALESSEAQGNEAGEFGNQNHDEQSSLLRGYSSTVNFDYGTSRLRPEACEELDRIVALAEQRGNDGIIVFGYTDDVGSHEYNQRLSESRARIVEDYLVERDINPERITTAGMGEENPIMLNTTPEGRAANRRVEIALIPAEG
jgi:outer membrane protein OmpA-like peptidoglycan-associated protein